MDGAKSILRKGIDLDECNELCDFGRGFYTTPDKPFAQETGETRAIGSFSSNETSYAVLVYTVSDSVLNELVCRQFFFADNVWARFVIANRCRNNKVRIGVDHNHDARYELVLGPAADGKKRSLLTLSDDVSNGRRKLESITTFEVYPSESENWGTQWSFHTSKAIEYLTLKDILYFKVRRGD